MSILRKLLLPLGLLYGLVTQLRNLFYDKGMLASKSYSIPVICVGNLSVGGTGKTPMIEYLLKLLLPVYTTATLSRGYGRKTKGYRKVSATDTAAQAGDEPLQFKMKFPQATVVVDEDRQRGISNLLSQYSPQVILLDDAFQHRSVKAGLNILLTPYKDLYSNDLMLPAGNLREPQSGARRAEVIVVTKCSPELSENEQELIKRKLKPKPYQKVYFSYVAYEDFVLNNQETISFEQLLAPGYRSLTLVTGIANPSPLVNFLKSRNLKFNHLKYKDHHAFTEKEISQISNEKMVITTEKDYMRLKDRINHSQLFYLPIKIKFINDSREFDTMINSYIINKK